MRVRCPKCKSMHVDPVGRFRCSGCDRSLAWHVPELWLPEQLALFQAPGAAEPLTLPFGTASVSPPISHTGDGPPPPETARSTMGLAQRELLRDSIALVTALLPMASGDRDVVPALLADQDQDRLLGLSATTAWLASVLVAELDGLLPGAGTAWLRGLALGLADEP